MRTVLNTPSRFALALCVSLAASCTAGGVGASNGAVSENTTRAPMAGAPGSTLGPGANTIILGLKGPIEAASVGTGVPADLLAAVLWLESRAGTNTGGPGAGGVMQIGNAEFDAMRAQHPDIKGTVEDPTSNILAGAYYMITLRDVMQQKYGRTDWPIVLRAYNSGENGVDPNNLGATPAGTGNPLYIDQVTAYWHILDTGGTLPS